MIQLNNLAPNILKVLDSEPSPSNKAKPNSVANSSVSLGAGSQPKLLPEPISKTHSKETLQVTKLASTLISLSPKKAESELMTKPVPTFSKLDLSIASNKPLVILAEPKSPNKDKKVFDEEEHSRDEFAGEETRTNKKFYPPAQAFHSNQSLMANGAEEELIFGTGDQSDSRRGNLSDRSRVKDSKKRVDNSNIVPSTLYKSLVKPVTLQKALDTDIIKKKTNVSSQESRLESDGEGRYVTASPSRYKPDLVFEAKKVFIDPWENKEFSIKEQGTKHLESSTVVPKKPNRFANSALLVSALEMNSSLERSNTKPFKDLPKPESSPTKEVQAAVNVSAVHRVIKPDSILGILGIQGKTS